MNVGDKVIYKTNGVCTVEEISMQQIPGTGGKGECSCYVLRPLHDSAIKIYVPVENEALMSHVHPVVTPEEMLALIERVPDMEMDWIDDMRTRTNTFRELLTKGDREALAAMIKMIYEKRVQIQKAGRKLYAADDNMLKKAEKLLFEEAAFVLEMGYNDIGHLFCSKIPACDEEV